MRRLCKHLCAIRVGVRTPPFYFSFCSFNINPPVQLTSTCRVPNFIVSASLLQTPCLGLVKLSFSLNPIAALKVAARPFCSEIVPLCPTVDISVKDVEKEDKRLESDVDKLHNAVIDNSNPYQNMEKALEQVGVELTTELVVEVLHRLRFEEKIAFRFFTWAGHQENYAHEPRAYNDMIDMLSSTRYKVKQFRIVCDLLDYMKRREKSTVPVEVLLKILRQYTEKHLTHLHKFAKKKRIRVKTQPEINAFNLLLDSLCKCGLVHDAEACLRRRRKRLSLMLIRITYCFLGGVELETRLEGWGYWRK
jgi:pentatricopeptide repeat protein